MTNPTSNFGWQMPTSTDLVTDLPADFEVFGQAVDTSLADLKGGTTGQVLKKNTDANMDFVWAADTAGMTNPMTTTGDTIYSSSGSTPARLGIGTAGQVLQVNSGATAPEWAAPVSGGMTLLGSGTLSGSSVDITSIPTTYEDLVLYVNNPWIASGSSNTRIRITVNNHTGANYAWNGLAQTTNFNNSGSASWDLWDGSNQWITNSGTTNRAGLYFRMFNYANTTAQKTMMFNIANTNIMNNVNGNGVLGYGYATTAITSLQIITNFSTFSGGTYELFGVK
jgi:hypothetical protein